MNSTHPKITNAVTNLKAMIESDVATLTTTICRELNEFETNAIVAKAVKAVCGTLTRVEGKVFLTLIGARQS